MKQFATVVVVLALAIAAVAQQPAAQQNPPAGQSTAPATTTPPPTGKRPPQAKTQPEFDAYQAAAAAPDAAAKEKAAVDFATKFPDSELRILLFRAVMQEYQNANNADKMLEMARKILGIDPDDPVALIGAAEVLVERTRDSDLDKDQRWEEATKFAQHALQTVDTDIPIPANTPQDKVDAYKGILRSSAYSVLGTLEFNKDKFVEAEGDFRKSIDAYPQQPDPVVVLRLALALDKQGKYPEALKQVHQAVDLTQEGTSVGGMARRERDRLVQLTGGVPESAAPAPQGTAPKK